MVGELSQIDSCLAECARRHFGAVTVAIPYEVTPSELGRVRGLSGVRGVVVYEQNAAAGASQEGGDGYFLPLEYRWVLPPKAASTVAYIGPRPNLTYRMAVEAARRRVWWFVYATPAGWRREAVLVYIGRRVLEKVAHKRAIRFLWLRKQVSLCRDRVRERSRFAATPVGQRLVSAAWCRLSAFSRKQEERNYRRILGMNEIPLLPPEAFTRDRVILCNNALAWGGAERQIVATLTGITTRGLSDVLLLCEHMDERQDHDFFLWRLRKAGIPVKTVQRFVAGRDLPGVSALWQVQQHMDGLPPQLVDDILYFAIEFLKRRPGVVHAWQDSTSVRAGLAAAIVGVPRIVLSGRNMAPIHFSYYLPYMGPGYRVLSRLSNTVFLNNSKAGAADYATWLGLPGEQIQVLFNGLEDDAIRAPDKREIAEYRKRVNLPEGVPVVGAVFRFYPEKDPALWMDVVVRVAIARPDVHFLLVGTGPERDAIVETARRNGLSARIRLPGTEKRPELPLSIMNVFLLTSKLEGTPNVVIEAQSLGVPVVATQAGGTADAVESGVTGWVLKNRSPEHLAARVLKALDDEAWQGRARARAPVFIRERFGYERMITETLDVYGLGDTTVTGVAQGTGA